VQKLFGGLLMACGILLAGGSGLCMALFLAEPLTEGDMTMVVLRTGGFPFIAGLVLTLAGYSIMRSSQES